MATATAELATPTEGLLTAAEQLIAQRGIRATSLRDITEAAGVNVAAVNYYFRSKAALVRAVYERCFTPVNDERLGLLDAAEAGSGEQGPELQDVLRALIQPMVDAWQTNRNFILLVGRLQSEPDPDLTEFIAGLYGNVIPRFLCAAHRAAPGIPETELYYWVHFLFGGVSYALLNNYVVRRMHDDRSLLDEPETFMEQLIAFGVAGLRAFERNA